MNERSRQIALWQIRSPFFRLLLSVAVTGLGLVAVGTPAHAHSQLLGTNPVDGAVVTESLTATQLTFNERIQPEFSVVKIAGPDGSEVQTGPPSITNAVLDQPFSPLDQTGRYTVSYRVVSADGHPISGTFGFEYNGPLAATASTTTAPAAAPPPVAQDIEEQSFLQRNAVQIMVTVFVMLGLLSLLKKSRNR